MPVLIDTNIFFIPNIHAGGDSTPIKLSEIILGPSCIQSDVICSEVTPLLCFIYQKVAMVNI